MFKEDQHLSEVWLGPPPNLYLTKRPHFSRAQNDLFFLARWWNTINGVQFPSCNGTVLNSCSEPVLVSLRLTHSSLSFSESLSLPLSFRPHCMCLTRLGLLFPASQPEHSKNLIYHLRPTGNAHTHIQTHTHTHIHILRWTRLELMHLHTSTKHMYALMAMAHTMCMHTHLWR